MIEQDQIKAIEWIIECVKKGADISQELIAMAEKELGALLGGPVPDPPDQADPEEIYDDDYFHAMELERGDTNLCFEDWVVEQMAEQMRDSEFRAAVSVRQNGHVHDSVNEEAAEQAAKDNAK